MLTAAESNPLLSQVTGGSEVLTADQSAYELITDASIFKQVFGSESGNILPVLGGWNTNPSFQSYALQFIQQEYGPPAQFIYATDVAPYIYISNSQNVSGLTLNQVFTDLNQDLTSSIYPALQSDASIAQQYGVGLVAYEGGQSLIPGNNDLNFNVMLQAQNDPRMYQLYMSLLNDWEAVGGGLFVDAGLAGPASSYGFWELLPSVISPGSQEYDALVSLDRPRWRHQSGWNGHLRRLPDIGRELWRHERVLGTRRLQ